MVKALLLCLACLLMPGICLANQDVNEKYHIANENDLKKLEGDVAEGNRDAMYALGVAYLTGSGVSASKESAMNLLRRASWKNDPRAQVLVAASYTLPELFGINLFEQDRPATMHVLKRAAGKGDQVATKLLGYGYLFEIPGVAKSKNDQERARNVKEARNWFEKLNIEVADPAAFIEGKDFNGILQDELAQAFGLRLVDGKVVSFDDSNYPEALKSKSGS